MKFLFVIFFFAFNVFYGEVKQDVLLIIDCNSSGINLSSKESFNSHIRTKLIECKRFTVIDRKNMEKIMDEMKLQLTGLSDDKNAKQIGKILSADKYLCTTISRSGGISMVEEEEEFLVKMELVNIETSSVEFSSEEKVNGMKKVYFGIDSIVSNLINTVPIITTILSLESNMIYIDKGYMDGIEKGKTYKVELITKQVEDKKGKIVFRKKENIGSLLIVDSDEHSSEASVNIKNGIVLSENSIITLINN